jgi:T5SS/PEP-CTERM-associated repeat protein
MDNSHGNFTVQNGGDIYTGPAELADGAASSGVATVTGAGSSWQVEGGFTIGYAGNGSLTISGGGTVSTLRDTSIAALAGSTGTALVTGAGSVWYTENLFLGGVDGNGGRGFVGGTASLKIQNGGLVQARNLKFFGGTLQVENGSLTTPGLQITGGKTPPTYGGPVGEMVIGNTTSGRMEISGGGVVLCNDAFIGVVAGSEGYVYLTGFNTLWQLAGSLYVAVNGDATLEVRDLGGVTIPGNVYIGYSVNTAGNVILGGSNGAFSSLEIGGNLYIGGTASNPGGSGVLRLDDYGTVLATSTTVYGNGGVAIASSNIYLTGPVTFLGGFIQFVTADNRTFYDDITLGPSSTV